MKKETRIQVRLAQEVCDQLKEDSAASGMTTSEFIRDLFHTRKRGAPLCGEAAKAFVTGLCCIQGMYPDDEELNQEVKRLCRYLNL